ncbi:MAG TPA: RNA-binding domain-containing protein [Candidatus Nitrosotenuis sp.]|nr:RNA-binding domain-containing protein [Candidatus Nitrosotenuis sp.]
MERKLEVDIQVIVHATEDLEKILAAFQDMFELDREEFTVQNLQGHYENPIILLLCKLKKKKARDFVTKLVKDIPKEDMSLIIEDLKNRCDESALHLRISKQQLVLGRIIPADEDPVKLKIYTPIYTQKDLIKTYTEILSQDRI